MIHSGILEHFFQSQEIPHSLFFQKKSQLPNLPLEILFSTHFFSLGSLSILLAAGVVLR